MENTSIEVKLKLEFRVTLVANADNIFDFKHVLYQ